MADVWLCPIVRVSRGELPSRGIPRTKLCTGTSCRRNGTSTEEGMFCPEFETVLFQIADVNSFAVYGRVFSIALRE